ncbi:MAG: hypothetical protein RL215_2326 [Planctomycetota bacterium]
MCGAPASHEKPDFDGKAVFLRVFEDEGDEVMSPARTAPASALFAGLQSPLRGFAFLLRHRSLWQYAVWPVLLNLAITLTVSLLLFICAAWLLSRLPDWIPAGDYRWLRMVGAGLGIVIPALGLAFATWLAAQAVLVSYFCSRLAWRVEVLLGTDPTTLKEAALVHQALDVLVDVCMLLLISLGCLAMNLIPVVGTVVGLACSIWYSCLILGRQGFDYPLSLRGLRRPQKLEFSRTNRWETVGMGAEMLLVTPIPLVGSVSFVAAVVGAVLLHADLRAASHSEAGVCGGVR